MAHALDLAGPTRALPAWLRFAAAGGLAALAFGARRALLGAGPGWPFLTFYPAVVLTGALFGIGPGLLAIALSVFLGTYFFLSLGAAGILVPRDFEALIVFVGTAGLIVLLFEGMHDTFRHMAKAQRELQVANDSFQTANAGLREMNRRLEKAERQKEVLLHETIHRFRNDLQRLSATIAMQMSASADLAVRAALTEVQGRITALASIKARLDSTLVLRDDISAVESHAFLAGLVEDWAATVGTHPVSFVVEAESHSLSASNAVLLGLVLSELVTNALKYAFPDDRVGTIRVSFLRQVRHYMLVVRDDGVGHDPAQTAQGTGLGRRITRGLAAQLGGTLEMVSGEGGGTVCTLTVPVTSAA